MPCEVVGEQRRRVVRACNMLTMAAERGRQRLAPSHFVAVRLATQHVQNRLETFKDGCRLHLTLALLTLLSEPERRRLCQTLQQHADQLRSLLAPSGLSLRVRGLDIMNDDPGETRVVFARVQDADGGDGMQRLADRCRELAVSTGLGKNEDYDRVKLHCTLMNVSFLVRHVDESDPEYAKLRKATFDARAILEELGHFDFGTVRVDSLEVVQRHSTGEDGFYLPIGAIKLAAG
ncbi:activating signal cointegrator 1 complex subunit 1-like [Pollicipes pollicipes]|uniref:activating signal cointegrator 1 complex subunit 1-like n=1 Tax=Pollicipes pollicipes TaxID=41117 RepID=UPI0018852832|nr:activating signal cointegrator 1 complex subunit 1-like [Pollicipes pollicipes]